ncbi:MAG: PHP domain-containing protein [Actinobacteria bacterium]|nr:PHP domain-containing protein [Actinomycetota bacterium]
MLVDLHVHTISSPCSHIDPRGLIVVARKIGLDAVCVTEHEEMEGAEEAWRLGREMGFPVLRGVEVYTEFGDMLVFGLFRSRFPWQTPFEELWRMVREAGGIIIPAHPCRSDRGFHERMGREKAEYLLRSIDALEVKNGGNTEEANLLAGEIASRYGLPGVGGSDAHFPMQVGRCLTVFERDIEDEEDLVREIRAGRCRAAYAGEVEEVNLSRAWR